MMLLIRTTPILVIALFPSCAPLAGVPITSPCRLRGGRSVEWALRKQPSNLRHQQTRFFASVHDDRPKWPTTASPSPYEIFGQAPGAPYSKARFFQLVKLYHPDLRHHTSDDGLSHVTKLDRYRLVVAANDLLSNPQKRRLYDLHRLGWDQHVEPHERHRGAEREWRKQPGNASMNATWEDWEQWYEQQDGKAQQPVFGSNLVFASIVATCAVVGVWGQVVWAGNNTLSLMDKQLQEQAQISRGMMQREIAKAPLSREDRVQTFIRQREMEKWAYDPPGHHTEK